MPSPHGSLLLAWIFVVSPQKPFALRIFVCPLLVASNKPLLSFLRPGWTYSLCSQPTALGYRADPKTNPEYMSLKFPRLNPPQSQVHASTLLREGATWLLEGEFFHKLSPKGKLGRHLFAALAKGVRDQHLPGLVAREFLQAMSARQLHFLY